MRKYFINIFLTSFLIWNLTGLVSLAAQQLSSGKADPESLISFVEKKHGLDQELINGIQYYNRYSRVLNHPYFEKEAPFEGYVVLAGKKYEPVLISYDIYSQHLVLEYQGLTLGTNKIILSPALTQSFRMGTMYFKKRTAGTADPLFYQVIPAGDITCLVHWEKIMTATSNDLRYTDYFSEAKKTCYMEIGDETLPFHNRHTYISLFSTESRKELKRYLRSNGIHFRSAGPGELQKLVEFTASVLQKSSRN